jgi:Secretion system C-terminal sorting domain
MTLFLTVSIDAQEFLDLDNTWTVRRIGTNENGDPVQLFFQYAFDDTIQIDSLKYFTLKATASDSLALVFADYEAGKYYRAAGEQIFYRNELDGPDYLLHDMGASTGDTIWIGEVPDLVIVVGVDSVILENGESRKRIFLEGENMWLGLIEQQWVEGIGGLRATFNGIHALSFFTQLQCVARSGIIEYAIGECNLTVVHTVGSRPAFKIFPNPATDLVRIDNANPELIDEIFVYTTSGKLVLHTESPYMAQIDVSQLPPDVYILRVLSFDGFDSVARFVKL